MGISNSSFGLYSGLAFFAIPQLLAAQHVSEARIAGITAAALSPNFWAVVFGPMLDVRFSRRWYATLFAALASLLAMIAVLNLQHLVILEIALVIGSAAAILTTTALGGWLSTVVRKEDENKLSAWFNFAYIASMGLSMAVGGELVRKLPLWLAAGLLGAMVFLPTTIFLFMPAPGPSWNLSDFDFDRDYKRVGMFATLANANNPDLRKFAALGNKMILYFGWHDLLQMEAIDYYETLERTMGGRKATQDFFRLFSVLGMNHCSGGPGAFAIDYLTYLEDWVERGHAPDKLIGAHVNGLTWSEAFGLPLPLDPKIPVAFTRPVYPYPVRAIYKGRGDPNDAANFVPVVPR